MAWHSGKPADSDFLSASVQHIRENFAELEPLQPHVAALLSSRIVDHNLDVPNPPNGRYIRFASGLQICWFVGQRQTGGFGQSIWTYPSSFSEAPLFVPVAAVPNVYVDRNSTVWYQIDVDHRLTFIDNNPNNVAAYRLSRGSSFLLQETHWAWLIAVGRRV